MFRLAITSTFALAAFTAAAQTAPPPLTTEGKDAFSQLMAQSQGQPPVLMGRVEINTYVAPSGSFKIPIPVSQELGGSITDSDHLVTFEDTFVTHITIANFPLDPTQRWELSTDGPKSYLLTFFERYVVRNYREAFKEIHVEENARFLPSMYGGTFIAFLTIPGGSNFNARIQLLVADARPRVAKYGVIMFVRNDFIYIISMELAEHAIEGSAYHQTAEKENVILRGRLLDIASQMQFTKPPPSE